MKKLCVDCRFMKVDVTRHGLGQSKCIHDNAVRYESLVTGNKTYSYCDDMREDSTKCGRSGNWHTPRPVSRLAALLEVILARGEGQSNER